MRVAFSAAGAVAALPLPEAAASTSSFWMRPAGPVPWMPATSMPSACATRRATGEMRMPSSSTTSLGSPGSAGSAGFASGASARAAPGPDVRRPITWPTVTVSPGCARISSITPAAGAGTSASTLSVEISTIVSSTSTASPGCLAHSRMTPSDTDSPIAGIVMSTVSPSGAGAASTGAAPSSASAAAVSGMVAAPLPSAAAAPSSAISASSAPTCTVSPSAAWTLTTVPDAGEGTSASTLSVEISTIVSSSVTESPSCLCHSRMVPSETESPIAGMTTWTVVSTAIWVSQDTFSTAAPGDLVLWRTRRSSR
jgi:hypothetical protein